MHGTRCEVRNMKAGVANAKRQARGRGVPPAQSSREWQLAPNHVNLQGPTQVIRSALSEAALGACQGRTYLQGSCMQLVLRACHVDRGARYGPGARSAPPPRVPRPCSRPSSLARSHGAHPAPRGAKRHSTLHCGSMSSGSSIRQRQAPLHFGGTNPFPSASEDPLGMDQEAAVPRVFSPTPAALVCHCPTQLWHTLPKILSGRLTSMAASGGP